MKTVAAYTNGEDLIDFRTVKSPEYLELKAVHKYSSVHITVPRDAVEILVRKLQSWLDD